MQTYALARMASMAAGKSCQQTAWNSGHHVCSQTAHIERVLQSRSSNRASSAKTPTNAEPEAHVGAARRTDRRPQGPRPTQNRQARQSPAGELQARRRTRHDPLRPKDTKWQLEPESTAPALAPISQIMHAACNKNLKSQPIAATIATAHVAVARTCHSVQQVALHNMCHVSVDCSEP